MYLHSETRKHCNNNSIAGAATGTFQVMTGFYELTDMPARFQMSHLPLNLPNTFCFLDDTIKISTDVYEAGFTSVNIGCQNAGVEKRIHCKNTVA